MEIPLLVTDFLRRGSQLYAARTAVVDGSRRFTYRELEERSRRLANLLLSLGVGKGDRVAMLSPNSHFFLESFYGTSLIGAILVPLNYRLIPADHEYILNHAGAAALLADRELTPVVDAIRPRLPSVRRWIAASDAGGAPPDGWSDWEEAIAGASDAEPPFVPRAENDVLSINYTSGTTARPKGVMLTHRNCYLNALNLIAFAKVANDDAMLWVVPMFHCNGWGLVYALTGMGGKHVVVRQADAGELIRVGEAERVSLSGMAPAVLQRILDHPERGRLPRGVRVLVGGAPPPATFIQRLETELAWHFIQIYGLTETAPVLTVSQPDSITAKDDWTRRARAGVPVLGVEIALLDPDGKEAPRDGKTVGEICARSNVVMAGYWKEPGATAQAIRDGWFHTGDLAVWDEGRNLHIVDRQKDVIISGGENISSAEIEDALYRHPAVLECAVIGVPDPKWGETPRAIVVLRPGASATERDLLDHCRAHLAHFKCPTAVEFTAALPRTVTGKLKKFELREKYWKGRERRVN